MRSVFSAWPESCVTITTSCVFVLVQVFEHFHNFIAHLAVQIAGQLVGQQDARIADDGARNSDALLTARKLRGK